MSNAITTRAEVERLIERSVACGCPHMVHLLRPVMQGRLNLIMPRRDTRTPPLNRIGKQRRPIVVLLGDDDYQAAGPSTWACADKLRSWATFAIVHGTGAQPYHYAAAAELAMEKRRLLFIETTSAAAQDWAAFLHGRPGLKFMGFLPPDGRHPVMPSQGDFH